MLGFVKRVLAHTCQGNQLAAVFDTEAFYPTWTNLMSLISCVSPYPETTFWKNGLSAKRLMEQLQGHRLPVGRSRVAGDAPYYGLRKSRFVQSYPLS